MTTYKNESRHYKNKYKKNKTRKKMKEFSAFITYK